MPQHKIHQGECIDSIAAARGLLPETIWDHPNNAALRKSRRDDPNVLMPGDQVFIPLPRRRQEACATTLQHRFRMKRPRRELCIVFVNHLDEPRDGLPYLLEIDGTKITGDTTAAGEVKTRIAPDACRGELTLLPGTEWEERYDLQLGHLDPVSEISGAVARLCNLAYWHDLDTRELDETLQEAIEHYQRDHGLAISGELDDATHDSLRKEHDE